MTGPAARVRTAGPSSPRSASARSGRVPGAPWCLPGRRPAGRRCPPDPSAAYGRLLAHAGEKRRPSLPEGILPVSDARRRRAAQSPRPGAAGNDAHRRQRGAVVLSEGASPWSRSYWHGRPTSPASRAAIDDMPAGILSAVAHPWLVPPADFNPEGISWAVRYDTRDDAIGVAALYECTPSEPAGIELSEWEIPPTMGEADAHAWLAGFMPDADAVRISRAMVTALAEQ